MARRKQVGMGQAAFRLCELYPQLLAKMRHGKLEPRPKEYLPEFVL